MTDRTLPLPPTALSEPATSWATSYRVRFDEAGPDGMLRTSGFMRYAQDLAWQHSTGLGFGRSWYAERGLTWLVRAAELVVLRPPEMGTDVAARTEIAGIRRVFARRHGEFRLGDGTLAGWVDTDWVLIDARGALTRIPPVFAEVFGEGRPLTSVGRIALPEPPVDARRVRFGVRPHELDPMAHANNAVYLDWLEEALLASGDAGAAAVGSVPRRYRMEFTLAVEPGAALEAVTWRPVGGWAYRLSSAGGGPDRFRAWLTADAGDATSGERGEETR